MALIVTEAGGSTSAVAAIVAVSQRFSADSCSTIHFRQEVS